MRVPRAQKSYANCGTFVRPKWWGRAPPYNLRDLRHRFAMDPFGVRKPCLRLPSTKPCFVVRASFSTQACPKHGFAQGKAGARLQHSKVCPIASRWTSRPGAKSLSPLGGCSRHRGEIERGGPEAKRRIAHTHQLSF